MWVKRKLSFLLLDFKALARHPLNRLVYPDVVKRGLARYDVPSLFRLGRLAVHREVQKNDN